MGKLSLYYSEPHPVHKNWFEGVGDIQKLEKTDKFKAIDFLHQIRQTKSSGLNYDTIICEDLFSTRIAVAIKILNPEITVIRLLADQGFYDTANGKRSGHEQKLLDRFVDGMIANSYFIKEQAEKVVDTPIEVVRPFIPELEKYLDIEKENYDNKNILFIGHKEPHKDVETLVKAVEGLDITLNIVGKGHIEYNQENVVTHGWVEDLGAVMEKSDLYIHPGDGEAFGVAPAEAMAAGIPTIVTESTGLKEELYDIDEKLVVKLTADEIREKIEWYYSKEPSERAEIGAKCREKAQTFTRERSVAEFKEAVEKLTNERKE